MNDFTIVSDRLKIIELINRFGMSIDLPDWGTFRSLFAERVEFDYSSIGEVAGTLKPEAISYNDLSDSYGEGRTCFGVRGKGPACRRNHGCF